MIMGIGIDAVEIERFLSWPQHSKKSLLRIFSHNEIAYCLEIPTKSAERFAARFAAKEAFYKALHSSFSHLNVPLLTVCTHVSVGHRLQGAPIIIISPAFLTKYIPATCNLTIHISITHTKKEAIAYIILENVY